MATEQFSFYYSNVTGCVLPNAEDGTEKRFDKFLEEYISPEHKDSLMQEISDRLNQHKGDIYNIEVQAKDGVGTIMSCEPEVPERGRVLPKLQKTYKQLVDELEEIWKKWAKEVEAELEAQKNPIRLTEIEEHWLDETIKRMPYMSEGTLEKFRRELESLKTTEEQVAFIRATIKKCAYIGWTPESCVRRRPRWVSFKEFLNKNNLEIMTFLGEYMPLSNLSHPVVQKRIILAISSDFPKVVWTDGREIFGKDDKVAKKLDEKLKELS